MEYTEESEEKKMLEVKVLTRQGKEAIITQNTKGELQLRIGTTSYTCREKHELFDFEFINCSCHLWIVEEHTNGCSLIFKGERLEFVIDGNNDTKAKLVIINSDEKAIIEEQEKVLVMRIGNKSFHTVSNIEAGYKFELIAAFPDGYCVEKIDRCYFLKFRAVTNTSPVEFMEDDEVYLLKQKVFKLETQEQEQEQKICILEDKLNKFEQLYNILIRTSPLKGYIYHVENQRIQLSKSNEFEITTFTYTKKFAHTKLLVQGLISFGGIVYSGYLQQVWECGTTTVFGQSVFYPLGTDGNQVNSAIYGKQLQTNVVIEDVNEGSVVLTFKFKAMDGQTGQLPFSILNPNKEDDTRLSQTSSYFHVWELE